MKNIVKAIVKNSDNKTIRVEAIVNGQNRTFTKEQLVAIRDMGGKFDNAVILPDGAVRGTKGELKKKFEKNLKRVTIIENKNIIQATRMISSKEIILYHGTKEANLTPKYGFGKKNNDYGQGFYTTPDKELAKEWAYTEYTQGDTKCVYSYKVDLSQLNVLDLTKLDSMHWVAELIANRKLNLNNEEDDVTLYRVKEVIKRYKLNTSMYDVIIGYRADDKYFSYTTNFVSGRIYKLTMEEALRLGKLGLQVFFKSQKAFKELNKIQAKVERVPEIYNRYKRDREQQAYDDYIKALKLNKMKDRNKELTIDDILRQ